MLQKSSKPQARQSNIELLRILAIVGVIILHFNNRDMGGGFTYVAANSVNEWLLRIMESLFACAVNVFILISGYFMCATNKRNIIKPVQLIVQVIAFSAGTYMLFLIIGKETFSIKSMIGSLVPNNYFAVLYVTLYLISPYINVLMLKLSETKRTQFLLLLFLLFSVWPSFVDVFTVLVHSNRNWNGLSTIGAWGSQWGYTIVNFCLLYIIGAYIGLRQNKGRHYKTIYLFLVLCTLITLLTVWSKVDENTAWEYCSPLVIAESIILFLIFLRIPMGNNKVINRLARAAFSVFLLHSSLVPYAGIEKLTQENALLLWGGTALLLP